ncbi:MAG: GNAT family N-acetyltransferase [Clostridia bacterium]|nr:GNAT family N-acetyltransferase [Clostridia bacterium]
MKNIAALKALWAEAFEDEPAYIEAFFEEVFPHALCLCNDEAEPASALYLIPGMLYGRPADYLFAAATRRDFRGKGLISELIRQATEHACRRGAFLFTVPAEENLFSFYSRFGFRPLPEKVQTGTAQAELIPCTKEQWLAKYTPRPECWDSHPAFREFCVKQEKVLAYVANGRFPILAGQEIDEGLRICGGKLPPEVLCGTQELRCPLMVYCPPGLPFPEKMEAQLLQNG